MEPAQAESAMPQGHCGGMTMPNLCERHCDYGAQSVNQVNPEAAPDVLALPLPWRAEASLPALIPVAPADRQAPRSHSPPPLALFGALRI